MKYKKFAKSCIPNGKVYRDSDESNWITDGYTFVKVPGEDRLLSEVETVPYLPDTIETRINAISNVTGVVLSKAIMTAADGSIADCVRVYATPSGDAEIMIRNSDWSLIEKSDVCKMVFAYEDEGIIPLALQVWEYPKTPNEDITMRGLITPVEIEEE